MEISLVGISFSLSEEEGINMSLSKEQQELIEKRVSGAVKEVFENPEYILVGNDALTDEEFNGAWAKTLACAVVGGIITTGDMIPGPAIPG